MRKFRSIISLMVLLLVVGGSVQVTAASEGLDPSELSESITLADNIIKALQEYRSLPYVDPLQLQNLTAELEKARSFLESGNYSAANATLSEVWSEIDAIVYNNYRAVDFYYHVINIDLRDMDLCENKSAFTDELQEIETRIELLNTLLIQGNDTIIRENVLSALPYMNETYYKLEILGAEIVACQFEKISGYYLTLKKYEDAFDYEEWLRAIEEDLGTINQTLIDGKSTKTEYLIARELIPKVRFEERRAIRDAINQTGMAMNNITSQYFKLPNEFRGPCLGIIKGNLELLKNATNAMYKWDVERALGLTYVVRQWVDNESQHTLCILEKMDSLLGNFGMNSTQIEKSLNEMLKKYNETERNLTAAWEEYNRTLESKPKILIINPSSKLELARLRLEEANKTLALVRDQMVKIDGISRDLKKLEEIRREAEGKNLTAIIPLAKEFSEEYRQLAPHGVRVREMVIGTNSKLNDAATMIRGAREILKDVREDYEKNSVVLKLIVVAVVGIAIVSIYLLKKKRRGEEG